VERHRITHLHMLPTMFVRLLHLPDAVKRKDDLSSLKFVERGDVRPALCAAVGHRLLGILLLLHRLGRVVCGIVYRGLAGTRVCSTICA
jgi:hypothetical protein